MTHSPLEILAARAARFQGTAPPISVNFPSPPPPLEARAHKAAAMNSVEMDRICALPVSPPMSPEEHEQFCLDHQLAGAFAEGWRLFPTQARAIRDFEEMGGIFCPIGVGWGKTLITIMAADIGFRRGLDRSLLLVPSPVLAQLIKIDLRWARTRVPVSCPVHVLGGRSAKERMALAKSGKKGMYISTYSQLSTRDAYGVLEAIAPDLLILDEMHLVANHSAARTRRLSELVRNVKPMTVGLSGTVTSKSIRDYQHLMRWCLGEWSPMPLSGHILTEWSEMIDSSAPFSGSPGGPMMPLVDWARANFPGEQFPASRDGFRRAYRCRMTSAKGVVCTGDNEIGCSLVVCNVPVPDKEKSPGWSKLEALRKQLEEAWLTPDGDEIEHAIHLYKWLYELTAGFYNRLYWPTPEVLAKRRRISEGEARSLIDKAKNHHAAQQEYAKLLRPWLMEESWPGCDTPMLVGQSIALHGSRDVGTDLCDAWKEMRSRDFEGRPERDAEAVRVCPYKIDHAVEWAKESKSGILWVHHQEVGKWLHEALLAAGVDCIHCPAGDEANEAIVNPSNGRRICVASTPAHFIGKNLQHWSSQMFVQWPRPCPTAEQAIGRTHRNGQQADTVEVWSCNTLEFDHLVFAACLGDTMYVQQTTGDRKKLMYASYDPLPKIYPSGFLAERGMQNEILDDASQAALAAKFGA